MVSNNINLVKIVYFTGTGSTERVAECFEKRFTELGKRVLKTKLFQVDKPENGEEDMLIVLFAVHAFNAPVIVYEWLKAMSQVNKIPAIVISVSGGGEISPNTACRASCIRFLEKKGYEVNYEDMITMPSNIVVKTVDGLSIRLLKILPYKVEHIIDEILSGTIKRTRPKLVDRFFSYIGEAEKIGARFFGKHIKVNSDCNGCALCERNCPRKNIRMSNDKPEFSNNCILCLNCIYGCPRKALTPGIGKFMVIKEGFNLNLIEKRMLGVTSLNPLKNLPKDICGRALRSICWIHILKIKLNSKTSKHGNPLTG